MKKLQTPTRKALKKESALLPLVFDGLGAIEATHKKYFEDSIRNAFADSLDLDKALQQGHEQENRWDYLLGHNASGAVVGVEPHSAKQDEITTVINKRTAARKHLKDHLRDGVQVTKWIWVASGKVHFANTEKAKLRLDQNGIQFVGTKVSSKHLG